MVTYAPFFISTVVMVGIIMQMLSLRGGVINTIIQALGGTPIDFMGNPKLFSSIYVWSGIWQGTGYAAVIYIASLSNVDTNLYEAAKIDGASRFRRMLHIDIPSIMPTVIILFIMSAGSIMNVGYEKILLMQNQLNIGSSDVIATYVYRVGLTNAEYSFSTAISLFNSVVNFILLISINQLAKKFGETSLF